MEPGYAPEKTGSKSDDSSDTSPLLGKSLDEGPQSPVPLPTKSMDKASEAPRTLADDWKPIWVTEINNYFAENVFDRAGGLHKKLKTVAADPETFLNGLKALQTLLEEPVGNAAECRAALVGLLSMCPDKSGRGSKFPTYLETNLIEFIDVKLLWQRDDVQLTPGKTVRSTNKKGVKDAELAPDYFADDKGDTLGDCVRLKAPSETDPQKLLSRFADDVKDKLTTYPEFRIRVIVDMTSSGLGASALATSADTKTQAIEALKSMGAKDKSNALDRLDQVDLILPGEIVVTLRAADLR